MNSEQIRKLRLEAAMLKSNGHAVILDETYDSDGKLATLVIHHYITCRACEEGKRELALRAS